MKVPRNLLPGYSCEIGHIWDCRFQEIDVATNTLLFEWRAIDHFSFSDMAVNSWTSWTGTEADPWDWFHLNSVQKDEHGNYLIAARYTNALTYIDGTTGATLWQLGGKEDQNDFVDLAEGNATKFVDPHMARISDNGTTITLFDNIDPWTLEKSQKQSRGLRITLNHERHVAKVTARFVHPDGFFARAEGSLHQLSDGNIFVGYGSSPVYAEFDPRGELLCSAHYAPTVPDQHEVSGSVSSYRIYKQKWRGDPLWLPDVKMEVEEAAVEVGRQQKQIMYVSWNGATEVRAWRVEGRGSSGTSASMEKWRLLAEVARTGFETAIQLSIGAGVGAGGIGNFFSTHRLTALDSQEKPLRWWLIQGDGALRELVLDESSSSSASRLAGYTSSLSLPVERRALGLFAVFVFGVAVLVLLFGRRYWRRRRGWWWGEMGFYRKDEGGPIL